MGGWSAASGGRERTRQERVRFGADKKEPRASGRRKKDAAGSCRQQKIGRKKMQRAKKRRSRKREKQKQKKQEARKRWGKKAEMRLDAEDSHSRHGSGPVGFLEPPQSKVRYPRLTPGTFFGAPQLAVGRWGQAACRAQGWHWLVAAVLCAARARPRRARYPSQNLQLSAPYLQLVLGASASNC